MLPIESLGHGFEKRIVLRITHDHAEPSNRLQEHPVRAERERQRQHDKQLGQPLEHFERMETC